MQEIKKTEKSEISDDFPINNGQLLNLIQMILNSLFLLENLDKYISEYTWNRFRFSPRDPSEKIFSDLSNV